MTAMSPLEKRWPSSSVLPSHEDRCGRTSTWRWGFETADGQAVRHGTDGQRAGASRLRQVMTVNGLAESKVDGATPSALGHQNASGRHRAEVPSSLWARFAQANKRYCSRTLQPRLYPVGHMAAL